MVANVGNAHANTAVLGSGPELLSSKRMKHGPLVRTTSRPSYSCICYCREANSTIAAAPELKALDSAALDGLSRSSLRDRTQRLRDRAAARGQYRSHDVSGAAAGRVSCLLSRSYAHSFVFTSMSSKVLISTCFQSSRRKHSSMRHSSAAGRVRQHQLLARAMLRRCGPSLSWQIRTAPASAPLTTARRSRAWKMLWTVFYPSM